MEQIWIFISNSNELYEMKALLRYLTMNLKTSWKLWALWAQEAFAVAFSDCRCVHEYFLHQLPVSSHFPWSKGAPKTLPWPTCTCQSWMPNLEGTTGNHWELGSTGKHWEPLGNWPTLRTRHCMLTPFQDAPAWEKPLLKLENPKEALEVYNFTNLIQLNNYGRNNYGINSSTKMQLHQFDPISSSSVPMVQNMQVTQQSLTIFHVCLHRTASQEDLHITNRTTREFAAATCWILITSSAFLIPISKIPSNRQQKNMWVFPKIVVPQK